MIDKCECEVCEDNDLRTTEVAVMEKESIDNEVRREEKGK